MVKKLFFSVAVYLLILFSNDVNAQYKNSVEITPIASLKVFSADSTLRGSSWGLEATYRINMADNKADWVKMLNVASIDISASYRNLESIYLAKNFASKGFLGNYYGIVSKVDFCIAESNKTKILLTPGFGLGYATQTFYTNNNPLVGSHINFTAQVGLKVIAALSPSVRLVGGLDLYHFSNAAFKLSNYGVNSINASIGIDKDINISAPSTSKNLFQHYTKHSFEFGVDIGRRGLVQEGGGIYGQTAINQKKATSMLYQSGLYAGYNYRLNPVLSLRAGVDAVYYYKTFEVNNFYATYQELGTSYDRVRAGVSLGTELWLGKVSIPLNFGHYFHFKTFTPTNTKTYFPPDFYWTFGARYYLKPWVAIEAKQYLHRTQADFAGLGLIFKIR
ncbi:acyloxyacyl hydrolase [Mucilaginibacter paludis]|uniref:Acyloxyacyl hydrolase n=1 Tax=Mucilaginibacter paludis DSM 18603 TaxID=714943 RepID=H1Y6I4_9SPHI|nr:acyloxyacyl hydrolase [Mucilaginibacter paludis]EHQ25828.1 hypothetical protein Mucpa_1671 [Mucilaginibacter paludis DSM 18603]